MLSDRLKWIVEVDAKGAIRGFQDIERSADKELGKAEQKLDKLGGGLTKFGAGAMATAGIIGAGLYSAGKSASDLGESVNAVNVTFGTAAEGILKLGEDAAESVGLANAEFNGLAVQFSSFATTIAGEGGNVTGVIEEMTGRAADFASVMNIDVAEAARLFQSGLAGETEPLKKFGIDLSAAAVGARAVEIGMVDSAAAMTEAEKVQARYSLLMQSTAKTQGDFANTADGAANSARIMAAEMENAKASLGESIAPIMAEVTGLLAGVAGGFSDLNEATDGAAGKFIGIGTAVLGAAGALSFITGKVITGRDRFQKLFTTLDADGVRSLNKMGTAAKTAAIGVGVLAAAWAVYAANQASDAANIRAAAEAVAELSRAITKEDISEEFLKWAANITLAGKDVKNNFDDMAKASLEGAIALRDSGVAAEMNAEWQEALSKAIEAEIAMRKEQKVNADIAAKAEEDVAVATGMSTGETMRAVRIYGEYAEAMKASKDAVSSLTTGVDTSARAWIGYGKSLDKAAVAEDEKKAAAERHRDAMELLRDKIQAVKDLEDERRDDALSNIEKQRAFEQAVRDMSVALEEYNGLTETSETDTANMAKEVYDAALDFGTLEGAAAGSDEAIRLSIESLYGVAAALDPNSALRVELLRYIEDLHKIPASKHTEITNSGSVGVALPGSGGRFHEGGTVPGPIGSEQVAVVQGGETIRTPAQERALTGGGNTYVTINAREVRENDVARALTTFERRNGRQPHQRHKRAS